MTLFYNCEFQQLGYSYGDKINKTGLSQIINFLSIEILTAIDNNIKLNFVSYLNKFVNCFFKDTHENIINECDSLDEKKNMKKILKKELKTIKKELIEGKQECSNQYYKDWFNTYKNQILPQNYDISYYYDIQNSPQKYLKYMIIMNQLLEEKKYKMFQFFPLRTNIISKHIPLDTFSIINLFIKDEQEKRKLLNHIEENKKLVWTQFFKLEKKRI